ncbi:hypothetical protein ACFL2B_00165 [Patescibacteria group bacterium]
MSERRPGGPLDESHLYEQKVSSVDGEQEVTGFNAPDGSHYSFNDGEQLVHKQKEDGSGRETFVRWQNADIPVNDWIASQKKEQTDEG